MKLYNSMTRKKEEFVPLIPGEVKMYVCGPTVYNYFHIGNARPFMIFDTFRRYLVYRGYKVTYVQNFTDVDDKIIKKANEEHVTSKEISEKYIEEYFKDADSLGIKRADVHPKVTETISDIVKFIEVLIEKGHAYVVDGDVFFDIKTFASYGKLSGQSIEELEVGSRVELNSIKKNPIDFVLWKKKKEGEPSWTSPWGEGRPGWHIECSVMCTKYLGETVDIHAGGHDLIFPHHENEIAQSESFSDKKYVNYWMHNGYINIDNKKMSKSKGNFFTVRDILKEYNPEVVRFFLLSAQYRNPVNFSKELIIQSENGLNRLYNAKENLEYLLENARNLKMTEAENLKLLDFNKHKDRFIEVMDDDFNTADGISVIFELVKDINTVVDSNSSKDLLERALSLLIELSGVIGILVKEKENLELDIEKMIEERQKARSDKNFKLADEIRDMLLEKGIVLEDTKDGVKWSKK
ncbi:cysteine--tRNA ligase [Helicovermis profundi]|uniref:Cysteine--tRNA ligase n=1 Tax=Helicovermis profundi TaxID=3065157 RepID=A0AAU9E7P3_9FIRM|nr:cysteine--tRNA ligase [Clostridia bacterium S502]